MTKRFHSAGACQFHTRRPRSRMSSGRSPRRAADRRRREASHTDSGGHRRPAVDVSERLCCQGREDLGVLGYGVRDAFASSGQAGVDELPHVAAVLVRTRGAARLAAVAAADHQRAIGLVCGRVHGLVAMEYDATQPDRMPARASSADLLQPALALRVTSSGDQAPDGRGVQLVDAHGAHRSTRRRGHKTDTSAREQADTRDNHRPSRNAHRPGETVPLMAPHHPGISGPGVSRNERGGEPLGTTKIPSDRLLDVESQLAWLRELGFDDVAATGSGSR